MFVIKDLILVENSIFTHVCQLPVHCFIRIMLSFKRETCLCGCNIITTMISSSDNQEGSDWRDEDEKLPGHENLTEKDIELFRHIQELALQVLVGKSLVKVFYTRDPVKALNSVP